MILFMIVALSMEGGILKFTASLTPEANSVAATHINATNNTKLDDCLVVPKYVARGSAVEANAPLS